MADGSYANSIPSSGAITVSVHNATGCAKPPSGAKTGPFPFNIGECTAIDIVGNAPGRSPPPCASLQLIPFPDSHSPPWR